MEKRDVRSWWGNFFQNQLVTFLSFVFFGGACYTKLGVLEENVSDLKEDLALVRALDARAQILEFRISTLEEYRRLNEEWKRQQETEKK